RFFSSTESVLVVGLPGGVEAHSTRIRVATEDDERRTIAGALHLTPVLARARPRNADRDQARVRRRGFDAIAVSVGEIGELIADHRLRRSFPRLDRGIVVSEECDRRMQKEMLPQVQRLVAGAVK